MPSWPRRGHGRRLPKVRGKVQLAAWILISQATEHDTSRYTKPELNSRSMSALRSIASGLERIGLVSLRFPSLVGLATVVSCC
jgi:hypothetical protein